MSYTNVNATNVNATNVNASSQRYKVERGAKWLDEIRPGWWREIDLGSLELRNGCKCILGQLYSDRSVFGSGYVWATHNLHLPAQPWDLGFSSYVIDGWDELDELWIEQIKIRWEALA